MFDLASTRIDDPEVQALIEAVQAYYVEVYGGSDDDPTVPEEFAPPAGNFLLGRADGIPVAMGGWTFMPDQPGSVKIRRMFVRPEVRRHGYARRLLDALESDARSAGASRVVLTTGSPQRDAIAFYRSVGYADVEPFGYYAASPTAVHLGKALSPR